MEQGEVIELEVGSLGSDTGEDVSLQEHIASLYSRARGVCVNLLACRRGQDEDVDRGALQRELEELQVSILDVPGGAGSELVEILAPAQDLISEKPSGKGNRQDTSTKQTKRAERAS